MVLHFGCSASISVKPPRFAGRTDNPSCFALVSRGSCLPTPMILQNLGSCGSALLNDGERDFRLQIRLPLLVGTHWARHFESSDCKVRGQFATRQDQGGVLPLFCGAIAPFDSVDKHSRQWVLSPTWTKSAHRLHTDCRADSNADPPSRARLPSPRSAR